jgi:hypothetical protein
MGKQKELVLEQIGILADNIGQVEVLSETAT